MTTDITVHQPQPDTGALDLRRPDLNEWAQKLQAAHTIGTALCSTSFAPTHFRGKPDEAAAAILYGSEVGFTPTQALQNLYVIGGKPALYARPMVAIVQAAGHEVWTEAKGDESVTVCGKRRGTDNVIRETWTIDRAKRAGYTNNKKYQTDPQAMLYARAASDVCRQVAADALAGMVYSVEEMELGHRTETPTPVATAEAFLPAERVDSGPQDQPADDVRPLTDATRRKMFALLGDLEITDAAEQRAGMSRIVGRPIASRSELTEDDAQAVIDALNAEKNRRAIAAEVGQE